MRENDFEYLASTGVNTPGTMFPNWGFGVSQHPQTKFSLLVMALLKVRLLLR
jgi:hypothetical protein